MADDPMAVVKKHLKNTGKRVELHFERLAETLARCGLDGSVTLTIKVELLTDAADGGSTVIDALADAMDGADGADDDETSDAPSRSMILFRNFRH